MPQDPKDPHLEHTETLGKTGSCSTSTYLLVIRKCRLNAQVDALHMFIWQKWYLTTLGTTN